ncbi:hypothetical protein ASPZODRAFT_135337 [Penicilliopsis zonata CBS 506.65]|uniref:DUF7702 domain-containing protein n=1 Tax=Penicilliopsis zonata CBS 506.65 TaxID=1073090 RepID=A0A1L9S9X6_9EURO|nr:hypothetical protein ASPZODRAFT_135337 [Penicilliopsis zonata CBS 506.65]OJJ43936.1 hypothetical protein ASPZODRAFT_135337 [Penicilliopsis zonata CBS 506.65]
MGTVTYRDGIAIIQLAVFPVLLLCAVFIWKRTGWKAAGSTWRFVITLSLLRIIGAICTLVTISNQSTSLYITVAVCELIGIAPLTLTYIGLLKQIGIKTKLHRWFLPGVSLTSLTGLILGIVGISIYNDTTGTFHATGIVKAALVIFLVVFAVVLLTAVWLFLQLRQSGITAVQKKLFLAIAFSSPFLLVRMVYAAIGDFANDPRFVVFTGNATIYLCMDVLEEIIAVALCVGFGMSAVFENEHEQRLARRGEFPVGSEAKA